RWNAFLEGEIDALMDAADLLDLWQGNVSDADPVLRLVAELGKMADAAELAGLMPVVSLCRLMIQGYEKVLKDNGVGQSGLLPLVLNGHECLINFIDELAGGQNIQEQTQLEDRLRAFVGESTAIEPAVTEEEINFEMEPLAEAEESVIEAEEISVEEPPEVQAVPLSAPIF